MTKPYTETADKQGIATVTYKSRIGSAIAAACLVCAPFTAGFEGYAPVVRPDPASIPTYCHGETDLRGLIKNHVYSRDECGAMLRRRLTRDYAPPVLRCVPGLADPRRRYAFAAAIDFAYNAGPGALCRSQIAAHFNAGRWAKGCNSFPGRFVTARIHGRPVVLRGLAARRLAERDLCMRSV